MRLNIFMFFILSVLQLYAKAQVLYDYAFVKDFNITVKDGIGNELKMPWAGGLNYCHFGEIDLNGDGTDDLVVFDKSGDRLLTFINNGVSDSTSYVYEPYYKKFFPKIDSWISLVDYNYDNKKDIFTYTPGGIKVFKNISDDTLKFQMVYPMINSDMGSTVSNITVTNDDYPVFYDVDNDGDIDILTFFGLGTYLQMHKNLSKELLGNTDTLLFELYDFCWGDFMESATSNQIILNAPCPRNDEDILNLKNTRHTGSTLLAADFNNDQLTDLVIGDVDYFNLILLINGGTQDSAHMIQADTLFPSETVPVRFNSFPLPSYIDVNNDGKKDLLVSPFSSVFALAESKKSIWYYKNIGTPELPVFNFVKPDFMQAGMIDFGSGAYPVVYDYNNDGLADIFVGNYGYLDTSYYEFGYLKSKFISQIAVLKNVGTQNNPVFQMVDEDYAGLSQLKLVGLIPAFGDMDNDGDVDMICGQSDGTLIYFENIAGAGNIPQYSTPVFNYKNIDVGKYSAPQIFDLNSDNFPDLVVGKENGCISYYQNTGSLTNPAFTLITDSLGKVCVADHTVSYTGHSIPCFFKDNNKIKLFVASESGKIFYYKDIAENLNGKFTAIDSVLVFQDKDSTALLIDEGMRAGITVFDFNHDGYLDIIVGNFAGGLSFYKGKKSTIYTYVTNEEDFTGMQCIVYPNPATENISVEIGSANSLSSLKTVEIQIYDISGKILFQREVDHAPIVELQVNFLKNGVYFCRITANDNKNNKIIFPVRKLVVVKK